MPTYTCPPTSTCNCFQVRCLNTTGTTYDLNYAKCQTTSPNQLYFADTILPNQVKYVCAVTGTIYSNSGTLQVTDLCNGDPCGCTSVSGCSIPEGRCSQILWQSGGSVTYEYITPQDDITGNSNMVKQVTVSSSNVSESICARLTSIVQISGTGVATVTYGASTCVTYTGYCDL
jgi:hypothetical protein